MIAVLQRLPFRYHWFLVVLMGVVIPVLTRKLDKPGEFYPFSNFPMYSRFEPQTYYVYLRDLKGGLVPVAPLFGTSISNVKKVYDGKLIALKKASAKAKKKADLLPEDRRKAASETLQWLVNIAPRISQPKVQALGGLELHQVDIEYRDSKISKKDEVVGTLSISPPSPLP